MPRVRCTFGYIDKLIVRQKVFVSSSIDHETTHVVFAQCWLSICQ